MIGRTEPLKPFEVIRWARAQAREHRLRPLEAHVLLVLATYANADGIAWPSIKTLALDCGLKVYEDHRGSRNAAVSKALARLEELGLLWTRQGGHGHPAKRELLYNPARQPPAGAGGTATRDDTSLPAQPPASAGGEPPTSAGENGQRNSQPQLPTENCHRSLPPEREASDIGEEEAGNEERDTVRAAIHASLAEAAASSSGGAA